MNKRVLVTGGLGYVGGVLVPELLRSGYQVVVYDIGYFGIDHLPARTGLKIVQADIRDTHNLAHAMLGCDAVIHLAAISNDPSFELDGDLSKSVNYDCFEPMVLAAKQNGVRRFIYASTSSVYGISDSPDVREDHPFVPITAYNKYKGLAEPLLTKHQSDDFTTCILRPATVCGYSPRMRLDLSINILTNLALSKGEITVFGGNQMRPNIHIKDMVRAYLALLAAPADVIGGQPFNCGMANMSIAVLAELVRTVVSTRYHKRVDIKTEPMADQRSYHVNSDKIAQMLGFRFEHSITEAIVDICNAYDAGLIPNSLTDDRYYNVRTMAKLFPEMARTGGPDATKGEMSEQDMVRMRA